MDGRRGVALLLVLAVSLTGCAADPVRRARPIASPSVGAPAPRPSRAAEPVALEGMVVRYTGQDQSGGIVHGRLTVSADGRASTVRDGERVTVTLSPAEVEALRRDLTADLSGHEGEAVDGSATDQAQISLAVLDLAGAVHWMRHDGGAAGRRPAVATAVRRVLALKQRALDEGVPDLSADVYVILSPLGRDPEPARLTWPAAVPLPTDGQGTQRYGRYTGEQARQLRAVLGAPARTRTVVLPDGSLAALRWVAIF
jgi:hypothetical protein